MLRSSGTEGSVGSSSPRRNPSKTKRAGSGALYVPSRHADFDSPETSIKRPSTDQAVAKKKETGSLEAMNVASASSSAIENKKDILDAAEEGGAGPPSKGNVGGEDWKTDSFLGLTASQVEESRARYGTNEIPKHVTPTYILFLRQFIGFMPILIEIAAIISIALQDYPDFAIILGMLIINACLGFREEYHAKKSLEELSESLESEVTVLRDGTASVVPVTELVPGDIVMLVGGTMVPADVQWIRGDTMSIDTAAMTGEPIPRKYPSAEHGDVILSGTTVKDGECYAQVKLTGVNTEMGAAQADVMKDKSVVVVSVFQKKIMIVVQCTISFSLVLVVAVILVQGIARNEFGAPNVTDSNGNSHGTASVILDGLSILIAAIPIALPLVMQVNMALGASFLAKKHHAIVTSLPAIQDIASMSILCSDKTGTLTTAKMSIITDKIFAVDGITKTEVLLYAYLCANADKKDDPIDRAIVSAFEEDEEAKKMLSDGNYKQDALIGFNPEVKRVVAFTSHDGGKMTIAKGLVAKVLDTQAGGHDSGEIQWQVQQISDKGFISNLHETDRQLSKAGYKTIGIAVCKEDARGVEDPVFDFIGLLPMLDPPRADTAQTIRSLHQANISIKMITGDHVNVGRETAKLIGLGTNIHAGEDIRNATKVQLKNEMIWEADGFAAVLPSDKREVVMTLRNDFGVVTGMTGDGVNDAPALSAAQIGIAVEGATDAAKNAADLILTDPGLHPIYGAVVEARRIFARIKSYVVYRIAASLTMVMTLSFIIFISGCAVDALYVIILALLNDISMIPVAYDNADATVKPQLPRAGNLVLLSTYFALFQTGLAMIFFYAIGHNEHIDGFNLEPNCTGSTRGFVWLQLVMSTELMIFSARAPSFFWKSCPSWKLVLSVFITIGPIGCVVARYSNTFLVPGSAIGWIWLFNAVAFVLVDLCKVWFKAIINDSAGEIIKGDGLVEEDEGENEVKKKLEKNLRYQVHKDSILSLSERNHSLEIKPSKRCCPASFKELRLVTFTNGFVRNPQMGFKFPGNSFK